MARAGTPIPAFERIKVTTRWAGHYAYNTLDHNAVVDPHPELDGFVFINGFSGHGLQQAAAMGAVSPSGSATASSGRSI